MIALDATYSLEESPSGVGVYSREMLDGLAAAHPETPFRFCYRPHRYFRSLALDLPANVHRGLLAEPLGPRFARLFHGLNQRLPRIRLRRSVATFHDLFVMTGEYSTPEFRARFTAQACHAAAHADAIVAVSAFTASQVESLLGVPAARIRVIHHGIRALAFPGVRREKIILGVGAIQKRKNIARLVEAFEAVDAEWKLVLAGSVGFGSAEILARIARSPARERISLLGYVSREDLAVWYSRAMVFAFPSLDEGFGMPILEAMAAGTPVLTSNRSALPEVAGGAAMLVEVEDTAALADGLLEITRNEALRGGLSESGLTRAKEFTWENAVNQTWKLYRDLMG